MRSRRAAAAPLLIALSLGALVALLDQGSKWAAVYFLAAGEPVNIIGNILRLNLTYNPGLAFGLPAGGALSVILVLVSLALVLLILRGADARRAQPCPQLSSAILPVAAGLALGAAAGNLADRLRLGAVVDFIDLGPWPVFNFADVALTLAAFLLIFHLAIGGRTRRQKAQAENC